MIRLRLRFVLGASAALLLVASCRSKVPDRDQSALPSADESSPIARRVTPPVAGRSPLVAGDRVSSAVLAAASHWERGGAAGNRILVVNLNHSRCVANEPCDVAEQKIRRLHDQVRTDP
ncbi:MAG: hypothetical protein ACRD2A_19940, partial [Vicinamibacterales bacterium]